MKSKLILISLIAVGMLMVASGAQATEIEGTLNTGVGTNNLEGTVGTPTPTPTTSTPPSSGGGGGGGGALSAPTPTPTPLVLGATTINLTALGLKEGDTVSATGTSDPDVYIINAHGFKRLFLNPIIFGFYGHLGGFANIKSITGVTRNLFVTSGLYRNCESNDPKVYAVEIDGEDTGILHWVNITGAQAVAQDANFFNKVFCINNNEFNWYPKGSEYTSLSQVPLYSRP